MAHKKHKPPRPPTTKVAAAVEDATTPHRRRWPPWSELPPANSKAKKPPITKKAASANAAEAESRRLRQSWPWPELPPANPSHHPTVHKLWLTNRSSAAAITKSWVPTATTTRCGAHQEQLPRLRHVAAGPAPDPAPHPHNHYLRDSVAEAAWKTPDASHWCVLKYAPTARSTDPPPALHSNLLGPLVHDPDGPRSGLRATYEVSRAANGNSTWYNYVSVWHECVKPDPFDPKRKCMELTSLVRVQGDYYYAMSLQGAVAVMRVVDTHLTITAVGASRAVPSSSWRFFKEYLFEMKGEILLVFLIHEESLEIVDRVEVYRLDLGRVDWVRVERLRGKAVFLKEKCIWVDSEEFGCRDDRVYFTEGSEERWKVFNMKTCCISPLPSGWSWPSRFYSR